MSAACVVCATESRITEPATAFLGGVLHGVLLLSGRDSVVTGLRKSMCLEHFRRYLDLADETAKESTP